MVKLERHGQFEVDAFSNVIRHSGSVVAREEPDIPA